MLLSRSGRLGDRFGVLPKDMLLSMITHKHTLAQHSFRDQAVVLYRNRRVHAEGHIAAPCRYSETH